MRALMYGLAILALCLSAIPAHADYATSKLWFASLPSDQRVALQSSLVLLGYYQGLIDGQFGAQTFGAIAGYQQQIGLPPDGVLTVDQTGEMFQKAVAVDAKMTFAISHDDPAGAQVMLPTSYLTLKTVTPRGTIYVSADGGVSLETVRLPAATEAFGDLYASLTDPQAERQALYLHYGADAFVVAGEDHHKQFYTAYYRAGSDNVGFTVTYDTTREAQGKATALFAASSFVPDAAGAQQIVAGPPATPTPVPPSAPEQPAAPQPPVGTSEGQQIIGPFVVDDGRPGVIVLSGDIDMDLPLEFLRALKAEPNAKVVELRSNGGLVDPALIVAHEIHERGLETYIPIDAGCYSACAFMFFAGPTRTAAGKLGVHQLYNDANDLKSGEAKLSDVLEALDEFGVSRDIVSIMLRTQPDDMHIFTPAEVEKLGINQRTSAVVVTATPPAPASEVADPTGVPGRQSLLLEASDNGATGAHPFFGTVDWSRGIDEAGWPTLVAKVTIPGRDLSADVVIHKNSTPSVPASHMIEINFTVSKTFIGGSVAGLPGVLLKNEELVQGTPLVGASARVVGNQFLFALSASAQDTATNIDLLTNRKWIDLAVIYATGKRAIITFEKDDAADKLFREVFVEWGKTAADVPLQ